MLVAGYPIFSFGQCTNLSAYWQKVLCEYRSLVIAALVLWHATPPLCSDVDAQKRSQSSWTHSRCHWMLSCNFVLSVSVLSACNDFEFLPFPHSWRSLSQFPSLLAVVDGGFKSVVFFALIGCLYFVSFALFRRDFLLVLVAALMAFLDLFMSVLISFF